MESVLASVLSVPACHAGQFLYLLRMDRGHCGVCHRLHVCLGHVPLFRALGRLCRFGRDRTLGLFSLCPPSCPAWTPFAHKRTTGKRKLVYLAKLARASLHAPGRIAPHISVLRPCWHAPPCDSSSFACKRPQRAVRAVFASVMGFRLFGPSSRPFGSLSDGHNFSQTCPKSRPKSPKIQPCVCRTGARGHVRNSSASTLPDSVLSVCRVSRYS